MAHDRIGLFVGGGTEYSQAHWGGRESMVGGRHSISVE